MTTANRSPRWTVEEVRALRRKDGVRRATLNRVIGQPFAPLVRCLMKLAASVFGNAVYRPHLRRVARRMNRHMSTAFDDYSPGSGDVVCSAYFKAGTNWVMHICQQIAHRGEARFDHIQDAIAWPDAAEPRYWRDLSDSNTETSSTGLRVIKSHLPANLVPITAQAKYVIVTRDPLDCAASGYHFFAKLVFGPFTPPPDTWLDFFGSDQTISGPWYRFTASWWAERHRENVLFLRFENMKAEPRETIRQIVDFLGVALSDAELDQVQQATSVETMRGMNAQFNPVRQTIWSAPDRKIIRKGDVGEGRTLFSPAAVRRFRSSMAAGLRSAGSDFAGYGLQQPLAGGRS